MAQVFTDNVLAPDMLLDVLSDRGFSGSHVVNERIIPAKVRCSPRAPAVSITAMRTLAARPILC